jgi:hypothetical protein
VVSSEAAFTIALFLQCQPLNFYWDKTVEGTCFDQPKFYYVDASLNMATDILILALPWFIFRSTLSLAPLAPPPMALKREANPQKKDLNLSKRRKIELLLVCSVGVLYATFPNPPPMATSLSFSLIPNAARLSPVLFACLTSTT